VVLEGAHVAGDDGAGVRVLLGEVVGLLPAAVVAGPDVELTGQVQDGGRGQLQVGPLDLGEVLLEVPVGDRGDGLPPARLVPGHPVGQADQSPIVGL
jgi:hypothetical protein